MAYVIKLVGKPGMKDGYVVEMYVDTDDINDAVTASKRSADAKARVWNKLIKSPHMKFIERYQRVEVVPVKITEC